MNDTTEHTIESVAKDTQQYFERVTRGEDRITVFKDNRPDWLFDAVYDSHGDMLPDDWKFACCEAAVDALAEGYDDDGEFADGQVDIYNGERLRWLASHLDRVAYVEDAARDYGTSRDGDGIDLLQMIGQGQYAEALEVFGAMRSAIEAEAERLNDEEPEEGAEVTP